MNRRKVLNGMAATVAFATTTVPASADECDADLIRLGAQFDQVAATYMAILAPHHAAYKAWQAGMAGQRIADESPRYKALLLSTGYGPLQDQYDDLTLSLIGLYDQIVAMPAGTVHGMAVRATAIAWDAGDYGFPEQDGQDSDYAGIWTIVHDLRAAASLPSIADIWAKAVQS